MNGTRREKGTEGAHDANRQMAKSVRRVLAVGQGEREENLRHSRGRTQSLRTRKRCA